MTERPDTDTDWVAVAELLERGTPSKAYRYEDSVNEMIEHADEREEWERIVASAAVGLRHLAAITTAIGDPDELDRLAKIMRGIGATLWAEHIGRIAVAASLTPTPTPDHDGHTIDVGPVTVHDDRCPTCGHYAWPNYACPDAWHNSEAT